MACHSSLCPWARCLLDEKLDLRWVPCLERNNDLHLYGGACRTQWTSSSTQLCCWPHSFLPPLLGEVQSWLCLPSGSAGISAGIDIAEAWDLLSVLFSPTSTWSRSLPIGWDRGEMKSGFNTTLLGARRRGRAALLSRRDTLTEIARDALCTGQAAGEGQAWWGAAARGVKWGIPPAARKSRGGVMRRCGRDVVSRFPSLFKQTPPAGWMSGTRVLMWIPCSLVILHSSPASHHELNYREEMEPPIKAAGMSSSIVASWRFNSRHTPPSIPRCCSATWAPRLLRRGFWWVFLVF